MTDIKNPFTPEQVREWERLKEIYATEAAEAYQKVDALNKALQAASAFSGAAGISDQAAPNKDEDDKDEITLVDAIDAVLVAASKPLSHKEIRKELPKYGFSEERLENSPNYYYTVINRAMAREVNPVRKSDKKEFWIEKSETADGVLPGMAPSTASNDTGLFGR